MGIVARRGVPGRRTRWTLDRSFFAYEELSALLSEMEPYSTPINAAIPVRRVGLTVCSQLSKPNVGLLFGSETRTLTLVCLAMLKQSTISEVAASIGARHESVSYVLQSYVAKGVCKVASSGRERLVALDETFKLHAPLQRLLGKLAKRGSFVDPSEPFHTI